MHYNEQAKKRHLLKERFKINAEYIYEGSSYDSNKIQKTNIWFNSDGCASIRRAKKDRSFNQMRRDVEFLIIDYGDCLAECTEKKCLNSYTNRKYMMKDENRALHQYFRDGLFKNNKRLLTELVQKYATNATWNSFPKIIVDECVIRGCFFRCDGNDQWLLFESKEYFYIVRVSVS